MDNYTVEDKSIERRIIYLFFTILILSQGIRGLMNSIFNVPIFNYHLFSIILIMIIMFRRKNKIVKKNVVFILGIVIVFFTSCIVNEFSINQVLRMMLSFIGPLFILLINYSDLDGKYILSVTVKILNIFIVISFTIQVIMGLYNGRTGGIIGHPLTAGWYYSIFISFNCIYCKYLNSKNDLFIIKDIIIALLGTVFAAARVSMIVVLILSIIYVISCCKSKIIMYVLVPMVIMGFLSSSLVDEFIWTKFRVTSGWGDVTNGRLTAIKMLINYRIYPSFFLGKGIGYSNYITENIFSTLNFENPILMFSYDYGILTVIFFSIISFVNSIISFVKRKHLLILVNFMLVFIVPFTYNGLAESIGIFIVLIFVIYMFLIFNESIDDTAKD